tara:strand:+ start:220 stop:333 length:114 start_codon:yes stop_codon:yes gene_type:complete
MDIVSAALSLFVEAYYNTDGVSERVVFLTGSVAVRPN